MGVFLSLKEKFYKASAWHVFAASLALGASIGTVAKQLLTEQPEGLSANFIQDYSGNYTKKISDLYKHGAITSSDNIFHTLKYDRNADDALNDRLSKIKDRVKDYIQNAYQMQELLDKETWTRQDRLLWEESIFKYVSQNFHQSSDFNYRTASQEFADIIGQTDQVKRYKSLNRLSEDLTDTSNEPTSDERDYKIECDCEQLSALKGLVVYELERELLPEASESLKSAGEYYYTSGYRIDDDETSENFKYFGHAFLLSEKTGSVIEGVDRGDGYRDYFHPYLTETAEEACFDDVMNGRCTFVEMGSYDRDTVIFTIGYPRNIEVDALQIHKTEFQNIFITKRDVENKKLEEIRRKEHQEHLKKLKQREAEERKREAERQRKISADYAERAGLTVEETETLYAVSTQYDDILNTFENMLQHAKKVHDHDNYHDYKSAVENFSGTLSNPSLSQDDDKIPNIEAPLAFYATDSEIADELIRLKYPVNQLKKSLDAYAATHSFDETKALISNLSDRLKNDPIAANTIFISYNPTIEPDKAFYDAMLFEAFHTEPTTLLSYITSSLDATLSRARFLDIIESSTRRTSADQNAPVPQKSNRLGLGL